MPSDRISVETVIVSEISSGMRLSAEVHRRDSLLNKNKDLPAEACAVRMPFRRKAEKLDWRIGRKIYSNPTDPFQNDNVKRNVATYARQNAWEKAKNQYQSDPQKDELEIASPAIFKIDKTIVGYTGYLQGVNAEGVYSVNHKRAVELGNFMRS